MGLVVGSRIFPGKGHINHGYQAVARCFGIADFSQSSGANLVRFVIYGSHVFHLQQLYLQVNDDYVPSSGGMKEGISYHECLNQCSRREIKHAARESNSGKRRQLRSLIVRRQPVARDFQCLLHLSMIGHSKQSVKDKYKTQGNI